MKGFGFALLSLFLALSISAASAQIPSSDAVENMSSGMVNWTTGEVYARGIGAPPAQAANAAQARGMAERAAFVVALRNLLETVKGVRVDSESVVENFMVKSDVIRTRVDGIVKGARIVKKEYLSDGSVEMLVGMNMKGAFLNAIVPETFGKFAVPPAATRTAPFPQKPSDIRPTPTPQPSQPPTPPAVEKKEEPSVKQAPTPPAVSVPETKKEPPVPTPVPGPPAGSDRTVDFKGGVPTGLVIDGRGLGLRPALLPKIVDQQGQEIYVGHVVTRTNAVEQGVAGYAKDVQAAANNFRVTDNPAVIKGVAAGGAGHTDIVIGQADAKALRDLSSNGDFLQYCRVIIVY